MNKNSYVLCKVCKKVLTTANAGEMDWEGNCTLSENICNDCKED